MNFKKILKALILTGCFAATSSYASVAEMVLDGTPGDWITLGQTIDETYSSANPQLEWNWVNFTNIGTTTNPEADNFSFTFLTNAPGDDYAGLVFSTLTMGTAMNAGETFNNAQRDPFEPAGTPGLQVFYSGRGCNTLTGNFTINQLTFVNDQVDQFSASFNQSCDGGALMHGTFRYDADATTFANPASNVPEPGSIALFGLGVLALGVTQWRKQGKSAM